MRVLFQDECHVLSGDILGYLWGKTDQRISLPIINQRERCTYYGALDLLSRQVLVQAQEKGNTVCTVAYLRWLLAQFPNQRLLIFWDGASYHRSQGLREFLAEVNAGLAPEQWRIQCVNFAPNDPRQNPIEDAWLQAKTWLRRRVSGLRPAFKGMCALFEQFFRLERLDFPKVHMYGRFS